MSVAISRASRSDASQSAADDAEEAARVAREALNAADDRILDGGGGTLIVRLVEPVRVGDGEELTRVTVGRVRVRHVMASKSAGGSVETYASQLVEPAGAFEELATDADYIAVLRATERALGNFHGGGKASSRS